VTSSSGGTGGGRALTYPHRLLWGWHAGSGICWAWARTMVPFPQHHWLCTGCRVISHFRDHLWGATTVRFRTGLEGASPLVYASGAKRSKEAVVIFLPKKNLCVVAYFIGAQLLGAEVACVLCFHDLFVGPIHATEWLGPRGKGTAPTHPTATAVMAAADFDIIDFSREDGDDLAEEEDEGEEEEEIREVTDAPIGWDDWGQGPHRPPPQSPAGGGCDGRGIELEWSVRQFGGEMWIADPRLAWCLVYKISQFDPPLSKLPKHLRQLKFSSAGHRSTPTPPFPVAP